MDKNKYAQLLQSDRARYYRIAYSYVKNEPDALDIVGEAACRGLVQLGTLRREEYFRTWMTRIVINCALDQLRRSGRTVSLDDAAPEPAPQDAAFECEDTLDLYDALDALPPKDRSCIVLRYFEERSFAEAAEILGEPEPTVKARVYRALKKLRGHMEKGARQR